MSALPVCERLETSATVTAWVDEAFGVTDNEFRRVARGNEEMAELITAIASNESGEKIGEEAADVAILLHLICGRRGLDLNTEIARKMEKNRGRQWRVDATGCGYHVKGDRDWVCGPCDAVNFAIRRLCRFCKQPRSVVEVAALRARNGGQP
jgi:NTP pyrophosphatase (non-canonical NTP hydrolase)